MWLPPSISWDALHTTLWLSCVLQGPLRCLTIQRVAWRSAAAHALSSGGSEAGASAEASLQAAQARAWLPITIIGVRVVLASKADAGHSGRHGKRKQRRPGGSRAPHAAAKAAARPAISSVVAAARRLLPGLPVAVQDVTVELQGQGLQMQLGRADLFWWVDEAVQGVLCATVQLHELSLSPGGCAGGCRGWPPVAVTAAGRPFCGADKPEGAAHAAVARIAATHSAAACCCNRCCPRRCWAVQHR
jgi:hypothetical protein